MQLNCLIARIQCAWSGAMQAQHASQLCSGLWHGASVDMSLGQPSNQNSPKSFFSKYKYCIILFNAT